MSASVCVSPSVQTTYNLCLANLHQTCISGHPVNAYAREVTYLLLYDISATKSNINFWFSYKNIGLTVKKM